MNAISIGLICSAGAAGTLSAIIIAKLDRKKSIPVVLSVARYAAWALLGGFIAAALLQKMA